MEPCTRETLRQFLDENAADLHTMSLTEFRDWLQARIDDAARQPLFQERVRIRDLRRQYGSQLRARESRLRLAEELYRADPIAEQLEQQRELVRNLTSGVEGLSKAVAENRADPGKLADYQSRLLAAEQQYRTLFDGSPSRQRLDRARQSLAELRQSIGLTEIDATISRLAVEKGNASTQAGDSYELVASQASRELIAESVADLDLFREEHIYLLHGLTLGCARGEFDQMVVSAPAENEPVQALALVEVKKNINDIVHGFRLRQENLAWLVGDDSGYEPDLYRTRDFPDGRFTAASHVEHGRRFLFNRDSFQMFNSPDDSGYRVAGLWFITNHRRLLGVTSGELGQILYQVSTNVSLNLETNSGLGKFRKWTLKNVADFQTRDVLELYARRDDLARQIILNR